MINIHIEIFIIQYNIGYLHIIDIWLYLSNIFSKYINNPEIINIVINHIIYTFNDANIIDLIFIHLLRINIDIIVLIISLYIALYNITN